MLSATLIRKVVYSVEHTKHTNTLPEKKKYGIFTIKRETMVF